MQYVYVLSGESQMFQMGTIAVIHSMYRTSAFPDNIVLLVRWGKITQCVDQEGQKEQLQYLRRPEMSVSHSHQGFTCSKVDASSARRGPEIGDSHFASIGKASFTKNREIIIDRQTSRHSAAPSVTYRA
jgi:hypothetical protein